MGVSRGSCSFHESIGTIGVDSSVELYLRVFLSKSFEHIKDAKTLCFKGQSDSVCRSSEETSP